MARGSVVIVLGDDVGYGGKVGSCLTAEPVNRANVLLQGFVKGLAFVGEKVDVGDGVNWMSASIWSWFRCGGWVIELGANDEVDSNIFLVHVNRQVIIVVVSDVSKVNS